ncbi:flagellar protein FlgN [bacterium AH-315-J21]|nr:flagellar protein FlgN [bacterium AH-315-J21]
MAADVSELIAVLNQEAELFSSFLDLLDRQRDMLVSNNIDGLNQVTVEQREKFAHSHILDLRRRNLVEKIARQNDIDGDITVTRLLESVSDEQGAQLNLMRDTILDLNEKIEEGRQRNSFLIEKSRYLVSETLKMINRMGNSKTKGSEYSNRNSTLKLTNSNTKRLSMTLDRRV